MKWKKVVITGGGGSIGSELAVKMLTEGAEEVIILDVDEIRLFNLRKTIKDDRLKCHVTNVRDADSMDIILGQIKEIDIIFHAAALKHVVICEENPLEAALTNILGTQRVVNAAVKQNIPECILISTDKAVNPISVMGATKMIAEKIFLNAAKDHTENNFSIVRFGNVANSRGSVIPILAESLMHRKEIIITDPNVTRFIMHIQDAVGLIFKALQTAVGGEIFVLKMPSFKLGDLADYIVSFVGPKMGMNPKEVTLKTIGLVRGEKMHESLFAENELNRVVDLGEFYSIIDANLFPKHSKYLDYPSALNLANSSLKAPRVSKAQLNNLLLDYFERIGKSAFP